MNRSSVVPRRRRAVSVAALLGLVAGLVVGISPASQALPAGFRDDVVLAGLNLPTNVAFAPDGRVFVTEKRGVVKVFDNLSDVTATVVADLRTETFNYSDSGMNGLTLDPAFPARPFVYVSLQYDAPPGGTAPTYGTAGADDDGCPVLNDLCTKTGRVYKLTLSGDVAVSKQVLLGESCQSVNAHAIDDVQFGPEGALYVSTGDGASAGFADYGQRGNGCGDPPVPAGTNQTAANAEGGALRSQDARTTGDPLGLSGTLARIDPDTGAGWPGNAYAGSSDANMRRLVAFGLRNPFRYTFRPGSTEIYVGDVGWKTWDEINVVRNPGDAAVENFGWPCFEGRPRQGGYDGLNNTLCETLYTNDTSTKSVYEYAQANTFVSGGACPSLTAASIAGLRFYDAAGNYPATYDGALFFADYARSCLLVMRAGPDGRPVPSTLQEFSSTVSNPVDLETGPGGDLFYVDIVGGSVHRISYGATNQAPVAVASADPSSGPVGSTVTFSSAGSRDPEGGALTYSWDLDGNGVYGDATGATAQRRYATAARTIVGLQVTDAAGLTTATTTVVDIGVTAPVLRITPAPGSGTWTVGKAMSYTATATDAEDGSLPTSVLVWRTTLFHCETVGCHAHPQSGVVGPEMSFSGPDHEAPAYLEVSVSATDSHGLTGTSTLRVDAETVQLALRTQPTGLRLVVDAESVATPSSLTVIKGSTHSVSAEPQMAGGTSYAFSGWSDGGAQSHDVVAGGVDQVLTATFQAVAGPPARAVNLGGGAVTIDGQVWQSQAEAGVVTNGTLLSKPDLVLSPAVSGGRASRLSNARYLRTGLRVQVPGVADGSYDVFVSVMEDNFPVTFSLDLEGVRAVTGVSSGAGGAWSRLGPYRVQVSGGALELTASAVSVNVAGVEIIPAP